MSGLNKNLSILVLLYNPAPREAGNTNQIKPQNIQKPPNTKKTLPPSGIWKCFHNVNIIMKETVLSPLLFHSKDMSLQ